MDMNKKYELLYKAVKCDINDSIFTFLKIRVRA